MNIIANELINLIYTPMSDDKIIEIIDTMGLEQPTVTEEYEEEKAIYVKDTDNTGIVFIFQELDDYSKNGEPYLSKIDFMKNDIINFPFNLNSTDDYTTCCKKIGKNAEFFPKRMKKTKIWLISNINNIKLNLAVHFLDNTFKGIRSIVVRPFNENEVDKILIPNKD